MNTIDTSFIPYLLGTFYSWCVNNNYHPYIEVEFNRHNQIPQQIDKTSIINIHPEAIRNANFGSESMSFIAMFNSKSQNVTIKYESILRIFTKEENIQIDFDELVVPTKLKVVK